MSNFEINDHSLIQKPKTRSARGEDNWFISYADIVTVLLCFFIIFYAVEKNIAEKKTIGSFQATGEEEVSVLPHNDIEVTSKHQYFIDMLKDIKGIEIIETSTFVDILFKKVAFFNKAGTELTTEGKTQIDSILEKIKKIKTKYRLEIHGHTDSTPVKKLKKRWWKNNMQLSLIRALNVYNYVHDKGIPKEYLIASGYGDHKSLHVEQNKDRRISLRLQIDED